MTQTRKRQSGAAVCCAPLDALLSPRFFKALADPNRVALLIELAQCCEPRSVSEIATCCTVDLSVVSRHLATLRDAGILTAQKVGKQVRYRVRTDRLASTLRQIADALEACCPIPDAAAESSPSARGEKHVQRRKHS